MSQGEKIKTPSLFVLCRASEERVLLGAVVLIALGTSTQTTTHSARQASASPPVIGDILPTSKSVQNGLHLLEIRVARVREGEGNRGNGRMAAHGRVKTRRAAKREGEARCSKSPVDGGILIV